MKTLIGALSNTFSRKHSRRIFSLALKRKHAGSKRKIPRKIFEKAKFNLIANIFDGYEPHKGEIGGRKNGVLISMDAGEIFTYALGKLDDRGRMFVRANDPVYEGMIVGIHSRDNDLVVNATRTKQLTNFRVSGKEDAIKITPPIECTLEYGVEFIEDDELVEITPKSIRLRKRYLTESERKRAGR